MSKFSDSLNSEFKEYSDALFEIRDFTKEIYHLLKVVQNKSKILETAMNFSRISWEAIDCIYYCMENGFLAETEVLLRWHLEMSHKILYLSMRPEEFKKWKSGKEVRPSAIGKYFQDLKFPTWEKTYIDLSNVVHANSIFIDNHFAISKENDFKGGQPIILCKILINLIILGHKNNNVCAKMLEPYMGSDFAIIASKYNSLEDKISGLNAKFQKLEDNYLKSVSDLAKKSGLEFDIN